jgi:carboxyl-terminal processing protease
VEVWRVTPGSPAARAGIKQGDEILSIDDQTLVNTPFRKLESMLEGTLGSKVRLAISRSGELKRFDLERAFLINGIS